VRIQSLVGKPEGNKPLGRPNRRWEDIRMDLKEIRWIHLALDADKWRVFVKMLMNLLVP